MTSLALIDRVFPVEILLSVFKLVDDKDRCRLCTTNRRWQTILYNAPELWKRLDLSNRYTLGGDKFIELDYDPKNTTKRLRLLLSTTRDKLPSHSACIQHCSPSSSVIPSFSRFSSITRLDLSCTGINLEFFSNNNVSNYLAVSLTHLIISGCPLVNSGSLYHLKSLRSLIYLDCSHCDNIDDFGLEVLSFYVHWIKELNLAYLFKLTEKGVKKLFRMVGLRSLNLMGCCRIKSYPWAITDATPKNTLLLRELSIGEDSRIQTRGFWLLWCTWQHWDMSKLATICPFLETIRLNMVLFDLPANGLKILLENAKHLKVLSLVIERNTIESLCSVAESLRKLKSLDLTVHIGIQGQQMETLMAADTLPRLKALKFHSKHTNVFNDTSLSTLVTKAPTMEYLELNGDDLTSSAMVEVVSKLSNTLQSLLLHHVKLSNKAFRAIAKNAKNLRDLTITDLQVDTHGIPPVRCAASSSDRIFRATERELSLNGLGSANKLKWLVSDPTICLKLKKIELASYDGFSDKDLAEIPKACKNLQWVDFHFAFTFPKTLAALSKNCSNLLYLRLFHSNPPISFNTSATTPQAIPANPNTVQSTQASSPNSSASSPVGRSLLVPATSPSGSRINLAPTQSSTATVRRPSNTSSPFMSSLYGGPSSPNKQTSKRDRKKRSSVKEIRIVEEIAITTSSNSNKKLESHKPIKLNSQKSKAKYPCSSAECQALIEFATPLQAKNSSGDIDAPKYLRKLRVLDLSGNHGVSDFILSKSFAEGLTSLHTLFLEGCDEGLTEIGVVKFAELRYKSLKRLHVRNCRGVSLSVVQENFLSKGLEVDLIVDGGRMRTLD
ncbi:hypothetical protein BDR26DRAFT_858874 [Obelidium mucronatum]|nr:hypothetical protein BDR26DRAFT_858874 [Obelidium mucronatum]